MDCQPAIMDVGTPSGVPQDVWCYFLVEADKVRATGRKHYSARTIAEFVRHHRFVASLGRDFVINNNIIPVMARHYMALRNCPGFFETRERQAA